MFGASPESWAAVIVLAIAEEGECLDAARDVGAVGRAAAQIGDGENAIAFVYDRVVVVGAVAVDAVAPGEQERIDAAAAVDGVVSAAGDERIVAKTAVEDVIGLATVDRVLADRAHQDVWRDPAAGLEVGIADEREARPVQGYRVAVRQRARVENQRADVGIARLRIVVIGNDEAIAEQSGADDTGRIGRGMPY